MPARAGGKGNYSRAADGGDTPAVMGFKLQATSFKLQKHLQKGLTGFARPRSFSGLELGAWSLELGAWSLELGAWSLELGAWSFWPVASFPACLCQGRSVQFAPSCPAGSRRRVAQTRNELNSGHKFREDP
ncbi:hypothetical protein CEK62_11095 [Alcanivorax sp. N3-2A]|nr:hypothetical protein CEK62_11095 [Alcanivorax sp. N3-2A]